MYRSKCVHDFIYNHESNQEYTKLTKGLESFSAIPTPICGDILFMAISLVLTINLRVLLSHNCEI